MKKKFDKEQCKRMFSRMTREKLEATALEIFEKLLLRQEMLIHCLEYGKDKK